MSEPRKATDVLLSIEQKMEQLVKLIQNKDLADKLISNKLNSLLSLLEDQKASQATKFSAEAVNTQPEKLIEVSPEESISLEKTPSANGFSRTSRPETFAGDNSYLKKTPIKEKTIKMPVQVPKNDHVEIVVPQQAIDINKTQTPQAAQVDKAPPQRSGNVVSIIQRVVDKNGKSIFLAEIEIIDKSTLETVQKIKTNATGKWMCSLPVGEYNVIFRKTDHVAKKKIEVDQNISVDGSSNPLELPVMIIK